MGDLENILQQAFGAADSNDITVAQMALRGVMIYIAIIVIVRLGKKRFLGRATAFDIVLAVMLGSIASRAITGNVAVLPALAACAAMVALHWLVSAIAMRWHGIGGIIKGQPRVIVRDGKVDHEAMRAAHLSEHDLDEERRRHDVASLDEVVEARLERSGDISFITKR